jgi:hypothetical protein
MRAGVHPPDRADGFARSDQQTGVAILACCLASVVWAGANAVSGGLSVAVLTALTASGFPLGCCSRWGWLPSGPATAPVSGRVYLFGALAFCLAAITNDGRVLVLNPYAPGLYTSQILLRIGFGVAGLLTLENLWRNTEPQRRWHVWPLCLAVGGLFAYELFLFSDAFITRGRVDPGLALGRALVAAFMAPLLALAMARNKNGGSTFMYPPSRADTATLGERLFLLAVAIVGMLLRGFGGAFGTGAAACHALRQRRRPCDRALLREHPQTAEISNLPQFLRIATIIGSSG